jgi:hypothetical protein
MASLAQRAHESAEAKFRFDESRFCGGKFKELPDGADFPPGSLESFSLSFVHGVSSFLKAAKRRRQFVIVFWGVVFAVVDP